MLVGCTMIVVVVCGMVVVVGIVMVVCRVVVVLTFTADVINPSKQKANSSERADFAATLFISISLSKIFIYSQLSIEYTF